MSSNASGSASSTTSSASAAAAGSRTGNSSAAGSGSTGGGIALVIWISSNGSGCTQASCLRRINSSSARNVHTTSDRVAAVANNSVNFTEPRSVITPITNSIFPETLHCSS